MLTCRQMMTSQGEVLDPFLLLNGKRYIPFSVVLGLPCPIWWLSLPFPTDLSCLSYPLGSFIYTGICSWTVFFWIIDIFMMTSAWILEAGFQQRLMEGYCTRGVDWCVCTLASLYAATWAVFLTWGQGVVTLGGDTLPSSPKGAECHSDESWGLRQYPEGPLLSKLAQVPHLGSDSSSMKVPTHVELSKENTSKRHHSFSKGMLSAHHGIIYRYISDWVPGLAELTI